MHCVFVVGIYMRPTQVFANITPLNGIIILTIRLHWRYFFIHIWCLLFFRMSVRQTAQRNRIYLVRGLGTAFRCYVLHKMRMRPGKDHIWNNNSTYLPTYVYMYIYLYYIHAGINLYVWKWSRFCTRIFYLLLLVFFSLYSKVFIITIVLITL
jgi:hypothetical protein